jgi:hypothetical protein
MKQLNRKGVSQVPWATTPSFITEVPLVVTSADEAELLARF